MLLGNYIFAVLSNNTSLQLFKNKG